MIKLRKSNERGFADHGWLQSYHSFSFADYHDPQHMGFRDLRVINEDIIAANRGFGTHPHADMEIVTYVLSGALSHKDSMGNGSTIHAGDVQYMSAGRGVTHSEYNHEKDKPTHLLQIWILPNEDGATPRYDQKHFAPEEKSDRLKLIVSGSGSEGSIAIRQDVCLYASLLSTGKTLEHPLATGRHAWLQLISGKLIAQGQTLSAGDALAVSSEHALKIASVENAHFLLFDIN